jgi:hypothetical protein
MQWMGQVPGNKKPRPGPGFFSDMDLFASLISCAENTRPKPAATATAAATDVFAFGGVHDRHSSSD